MRFFRIVGYGLGAYLLFVVNDHGVSVYVGTLVVSALVALLAWPLSYLAFRLRGGYFAVGTWVIAEVVRLIVVRFDSLGAAGGRSLSDVTADPVLRRAFTYWLALAVMAAAALGTFAVLRSRLGLALQAIRDDDTAAGSLGVNVTRGKRIIYIAAAAGCAATGGVICVNSLGVASPTQISDRGTAGRHRTPSSVASLSRKTGSAMAASLALPISRGLAAVDAVGAPSGGHVT
ncbi:branched-chain amino acid ABC transporter permease [Streptomyces sp. NPDC013187]|uniref:branched-chain amino acid ABC transporter permease n=1 Tax=Streptomyces sp. NPDC013187 TaxID=3364865 RepID=UPI00367896BD